MHEDVPQIARRSREAAALAARAGTEQKNDVLRHLGRLLEEQCGEIVAANRADMDAGSAGVSGALLKRLEFDASKVQSRIESLKLIAELPDPVGQVSSLRRLPNGLLAGRMRVPIGVLLVIYEARPHVTINGGALGLKAGNAVIMRGGSEAKRCNALLGRLWAESLAANDLPGDAVQVISTSHDAIAELLQLDDLIDLVIPRGGKGLIRTVAEQSRIPVIKHFEGVCHVYVGEQADTTKALKIILDSKLLMPAVCNAAETVLVDSAMKGWLPLMLSAMADSGIEIRGCQTVCDIAPGAKPATDEDWGTEYLDTICSVRVVKDLSEAIAHLSQYGSGHTDTIVTENYSHAQRFVREVDSSVVLVNASTMFCDGQALGMGAEIGISTDKLHARGPMGLEELTSYKHVIYGEGQVMGSREDWGCT